MEKLVVIPTYNERENISKMISKVMSLEGGYHLLVVDDGSPDGTGAIVKERQGGVSGSSVSVGTLGKTGVGHCLYRGIPLGAGSPVRCRIRNGLRFFAQSRRSAAAYRRIGGWSGCRRRFALFEGGDGGELAYVAAVDVLLCLAVCADRMPVCDATAGFVGYKREVLAAIDFDRIEMVGYGFQIEMKYTAWKMGFRIGEVPIIFADRTEGTSKMSGGIFGEAFFGVLALPFRTIARKK